MPAHPILLFNYFISRVTRVFPLSCPPLPPATVQVKSLIEELGQFGLPIWVTEFDWSGSESDHSQHARQLEDFYRLMFRLPQVQLSL